MRVIAAWAALLIGSGAFIATLIANWRHQASLAAGIPPNGVELVWSLIPWLIVALCVAPSALGLASLWAP